jgi:hypothetical protein
VARDRHANPIDPSYLSARSPHLFKESMSAMSYAPDRPSLSRRFEAFRPYPRPYVAAVSIDRYGSRYECGREQVQ